MENQRNIMGKETWTFFGFGLCMGLCEKLACAAHIVNQAIVIIINFKYQKEIVSAYYGEEAQVICNRCFPLLFHGWKAQWCWIIMS